MLRFDGLGREAPKGSSQLSTQPLFMQTSVVVWRAIPVYDLQYLSCTEPIDSE